MTRLEAGLGEGQRQLSNPLRDPVEITGAAEELTQDPGIELVLGNEDALGEGCGRVGRQDRDFDLAKDFPAIEVGGDEMNSGAAAMSVSSNALNSIR